MRTVYATARTSFDAYHIWYIKHINTLNRA